jgi:L-fuculose-phosphate aldolase
MNEQQLREQICQIGRLMHQFGFVEGASGNISARLDAERILVTPSGLAKGFMQPEQLIIVDMEGRKIEETAGDAHLRPTSELPMHLEAYHKRSDVNGVVHAHPPHAVALSIAGISMETPMIPEMVIMMGAIPTTPYATPSSTENRDAIAAVIERHDAILLAYHGSLTVGKDVWLAYLRLESMEHVAKILFMVHQLGGGKPLPPEQVEKLLALRRQFGLARPNE